jgi:hypothetical protein
MLARELAAFHDDEPDWEALERLEYLDDTVNEKPTVIPGAGISDPAGPLLLAAGRGAGFAHGGTADTMPPGPALAELADRAWQDGLGRLNDDELTGVLQAAHRLGAWAAALELSAVSDLAARRAAEARASGDWRAFEHVEDEVAVALTMTRHGAGFVLNLALALDRLPLTRAALAAGAIDERRAWVIADEVSGLDDEHAAAVEACVIGKAAEQTTGQLRPAVRRAVIAADPAAAKRRKEEALKGARVEASSESSGTASLSGRDLPPAQVLAADKNLTALAQEMKKAGVQGTMDQLRACAYLHLLAGQPASTLFTPVSPSNGTAGTPGDETPGGRTGSGGTGPAETGAHRPGRSALRGTVNLTMPLSTWLGWSESPGQVPGFGTLDAGDSRALAAMLAGHPANKWCITITDAAGHAIAHGCATQGPRPYGTAGTGLVTGTGPRAGPGSWQDPGPPPNPGWIAGVTITPLQTGNCTHSRETPAYQPGAMLRHIIQIRQATCSHPGCRWAATACDLDHTVPYHLGGRTCECGVGPLCRRHHIVKQTPGWTLAQRQPGIMTLTTPSHRTYTTHPTSYPA